MKTYIPSHPRDYDPPAAAVKRDKANVTEESKRSRLNEISRPQEEPSQQDSCLLRCLSLGGP